MKKWSQDELKSLPVENGFRLRGHMMTRLETFTDAAFAFAITMLVISVGKIPGNLNELIYALKSTPAFLIAFIMIMLFWSNHREWSRNYGLDSFLSRFITFILIFIILIYIYPLRLLASSIMSFFSNGFFPSEFIISEISDIPILFIIYGIGFMIISTLFSILFYLGLKAVCATTGLIAIIIAASTSVYIGILSGWIYSTLPLSVYITSYLIYKKSGSSYKE